MEITEVRVRLVQDGGQERLRAFVTVTFDNCFVVREIKVIEGDQGHFVAMPSRKSMRRCRKCRARNVVQASYCNSCGEKLPAASGQETRREKLYLDVAHPINSACRRMLHEAIMKAYEEELAAEEVDAPVPQDGAASPGEVQAAPTPDSEETKEYAPDLSPPDEQDAAPGPDEDLGSFDRGIFT